MGIYTAEGLVKHAERALALDTAYMWGGIMRKITPAYISQLRKVYGTKAGTGYTGKRYEQLEKLAGSGYFGCDCVGLIKSYYWSGRPDGGTGSPKYGAAGFPDVNAGMMFGSAKIKGSIDTLPERPGVILYCGSSPHVGVYVGNGDVIECTLSARGDGVVRTRLGDFGWEYWFECPYISYPKAASAKPEKTFSAGDTVYIKASARCYSGTGVAIPSRFKGRSRKYTISKLGNGRALLKELFSWVDITDLSEATSAKPEKTFSAGDTVYIKASARCYSGTGVAIPSRFKGRSRKYTISKLGDGRALLKELFSWVDIADLSEAT